MDIGGNIILEPPSASCSAAARMPSLDELDDGECANEAQQQPPYENHSVIMEVR